MAKKIVIKDKKDKEGKREVEVELTEFHLKDPNDIHEFHMLINMAKRQIMRMRKEE